MGKPQEASMWTRVLVVLSRLRAALLGARLDTDFRDELRSHLDLLAEDQRGRGLTAAEASRQALLQLGGLTQVAEEHRDRRGVPLAEEALRDFRYALRSLRKNPLFSMVVVATLAIGIGAGTVVFAVAGAVLLRPLPYAHPDQLVRVFET